MLGLACSRLARPSLVPRPRVLARALHATRGLRNSTHTEQLTHQQEQQPPTQNIQEEEPIVRLLEPELTKYQLPLKIESIQLLKVNDMLREGERLLKMESFEKAEAALIAVVDYMGTNKLEDKWLSGKAFANLGFALHQNYKYEQAMANYGHGLKMLMEGDPERESHFVGMRLLSFSELFSIQGMNAGAVTTCSKAVQHLEAAHGKTDTYVGLALNNLASYLLLEQKPDNALPHAERAFQILSTNLGKHNATTRNCAINLANVYKALEKQDDLSDLDDAFMTDDAPILKPKPGTFDEGYIQSLKTKWYKQGPRAIFDPPGLHRSAELSARSYAAFLNEWKNKYPLTNNHASIMIPEIQSLKYTHDLLPKFTPRPVTSVDGKQRAGLAQQKFRYPFEKEVDKKMHPPKLSLAKELDKEEALYMDSIETPMDEAELTISDSEWKILADRQKEYRKQHGDPMREAVEDEFARSEEDYRLEAPRTGHVLDQKIMASEVQEEEDWDSDTYDLTKAIVGTPEEQAFERSKTPGTPQGVGEDPEKEYMKKDEQDRLALKEARLKYVENQGEEDDSLALPEFYDDDVETAEDKEKFDAQTLKFEEKMARVIKDPEDQNEAYEWDNEPLDGDVELHPALKFTDLETLGPNDAKMQEQFDDDIDPSSPFWEGRQPTGPIGSGPNPSPSTEPKKQNEFEKGKSGAYAHNPEEDDVFPDRAPEGHSTYSPEKDLNDRQFLKRRRPEYKYGKLHEIPWHDDYK